MRKQEELFSSHVLFDNDCATRHHLLQLLPTLQEELAPHPLPDIHLNSIIMPAVAVLVLLGGEERTSLVDAENRSEDAANGGVGGAEPGQTIDDGAYHHHQWQKHVAHGAHF